MISLLDPIISRFSRSVVFMDFSCLIRFLQISSPHDEALLPLSLPQWLRTFAGSFRAPQVAQCPEFRYERQGLARINCKLDFLCGRIASQKRDQDKGCIQPGCHASGAHDVAVHHNSGIHKIHFKRSGKVNLIHPLEEQAAH